MHGDLLLFVAVLVIGCAAFFFGVVYLLCQLIGGVGRAFVGLFRGNRHEGAAEKPGGNARIRVQVCPRANCRTREHRPARFCSRCGAPLDRRPQEQGSD